MAGVDVSLKVKVANQGMRKHSTRADWERSLQYDLSSAQPALQPKQLMTDVVPMIIFRVGLGGTVIDWLICMVVVLME